MSRVEISGADAAADHLLRLIVERRAATRRATAKAAHHAERHIKLQLSRTSHPRGTPTPSQPGDPPSLVTGTLRRSIRVHGPTATAGGWEARVGPTARYGRIHEFGGVTGRGHRTRLPPRPYVGPGLRAALPGVEKAFRQELASR